MENKIFLDNSISETPMEKNIKFFDGGNEVGCLDWEDGKMKFFGNADKSAKVFIKWVQLQWDMQQSVAEGE